MGNLTTVSSRHFQLEQLAEGVFAAIHADGGWAICNAGIIDLGDRTLVFDAFESIEAARDLRNAAESLLGRPVHALINSHYHNDHIWGNQVFAPDMDIISSTKTRELIATEGPVEEQGYRDVAPKRVEALKAQLEKTGDETERWQINFFIIEYQAILATLPELKLCLPNLTFSGELNFIGSKRSARLITYQGGHCGSDTLLHLPDDGIVFMGDLLFINCHPYLLESVPDEIHRIMAEVRKLQAHTFVPGHGPVGQAGNLDWMDEYIDRLNALVSDVIQQEALESEIDKIAMPGDYRNMVAPTFFTANLKFLYQRRVNQG